MATIELNEQALAAVVLSGLTPADKERIFSEAIQGSLKGLTDVPKDSYGYSKKESRFTEVVRECVLSVARAAAMEMIAKDEGVVAAIHSIYVEAVHGFFTKKENREAIVAKFVAAIGTQIGR